MPVLSNSYIIRIAPGEYDYLIPRSDGSIVVGGGRRDYVKDLSSWYNNADDSKLIESAKNYFDGYMQKYFSGWENVSVKLIHCSQLLTEYRVLLEPIKCGLGVS